MYRSEKIKIVYEQQFGANGTKLPACIKRARSRRKCTQSNRVIATNDIAYGRWIGKILFIIERFSLICEVLLCDSGVFTFGVGRRYARVHNRNRWWRAHIEVREFADWRISTRNIASDFSNRADFPVTGWRREYEKRRFGDKKLRKHESRVKCRTNFLSNHAFFLQVEHWHRVTRCLQQSHLTVIKSHWRL